MEKIKCPICNNFQTKELFIAKDHLKISDQNFSIRKCLNCEIVFTFPTLTRKEVEKFYPKHYFWKKECETKNILIKLLKKIETIYFQFILKFILEHETKRLSKLIGRKGGILDVGCGNGMRIEAFKKLGFSRYYGIEPMEEGYRNAKEIKKLPIGQKTLEEFNCPENSFDIITLYHTFEHLHDPVKHLGIIKKILNPEGWLVIEVPNLNSWQARLFKEKWSALDLPRHYFHYTPKNLSNLLSRNGFEVKFIDRKANFLRPLFWGLSLFPVHPQAMWQREEKGKGTAFSKIWWILLILLSIIPTELENIFGEAGHMTIYAINQKK